MYHVTHVHVYLDPEGDLEECVAIDPSDHAAWRVLADVSRERGDCEEAFLRLRRAQAAAPNSAKIAQEVFAAARAARDQIRGGKGTYEGRRVPSGVDARGGLARSRGRGLSGARRRTGRSGRRPVAGATAT